MTFKQWDFALDTGDNMTDYGAGYRPTYYLKCTQLGQFEVIINDRSKLIGNRTRLTSCRVLLQVSSGSPYSLVPAEVNVDWYLSVCQKLFNNLTTARPNTDDVNTNFGFVVQPIRPVPNIFDDSLCRFHSGGEPTGCNMAFVQSANDPYSSLGPNAAALAKDYATTGNKIIEVTTQIVVLK